MCRQDLVRVGQWHSAGGEVTPHGPDEEVGLGVPAAVGVNTNDGATKSSDAREGAGETTAPTPHAGAGELTLQTPKRSPSM